MMYGKILHVSTRKIVNNFIFRSQLFLLYLLNQSKNQTMETKLNLVSRTHKGCTYFASSEAELAKVIEKAVYNHSIFYRSRVYDFSCYARRLEDGRIEKTSFYQNGAAMKRETFADIDTFWKLV